MEGETEETEGDSSEEGKITFKNIRSIALCILISTACILVAIIIIIAIKYKGKGN